MSAGIRCSGALAALLLAAGCTDRPNPLEPQPGSPPTIAVQPDGTPGLSRQQARHERMARRLALALRDDQFRAAVFGALQKSGEREGKVHLQRLLAEDRGWARRRLAELAGEAEASVAADLNDPDPVEIYLPVRSHRRGWVGTPNLLVATAERDHDAPVAFDTWGRRRLLDPDLPPAMPVLALGRAEAAFGGGGPVRTSCPTCDEDPDGGVTNGGSGGGAGGGGGGVPAPGAGGNLYMTYASFDGTFEGWLKGDPEFEVHVLGQEGQAAAMTSYQCAGQQAGGAYTYDQNDRSWSGSVLLFSAAQFAEYEAAHPGQAVRILVVEDDDAACTIKADSSRVDRMFRQLIATYGTLLGGKKDSLFSVKTFTKAVSIWNLARTFWSFITTQDDIVGYAIEDAVAGEYVGGANWIVKGENTITHGAIRLELR